MRRVALLVVGLVLAGFGTPQVAAAFGNKVQYDIKLPSGFERQVTGNPGQGVEATRFAGRQRRDGTRPVLVVTTVQLPADREKRGDEALREMLVDKHISELRTTFNVNDYVREATKVGAVLRGEAHLGERVRRSPPDHEGRAYDRRGRQAGGDHARRGSGRHAPGRRDRHGSRDVDVHADAPVVGEGASSPFMMPPARARCAAFSDHLSGSVLTKGRLG